MIYSVSIQFRQVLHLMPIVFLFWAAQSLADPVTTLENRINQPEFIDLENLAVEKRTDIDAASQSLNKQRKELNLKLDPSLISTLRNSTPNEIAQDKATAVKRSIAEIRASALKHNLDLKIVMASPDIASTLVDEERAKFDNIIFANLKYSRKDLPEISGDNIKFTSNNSDLDNQLVKLNKTPTRSTSIDAALGIEIPLRTGGNIQISSPFESINKTGDFDSNEYRAGLKFSISQPLLRNAGVAVNEASINIAAVGQQAVRARTRLQSIRIIATIDKAYWALNQAWTELEIRQQQYDYAIQNLAMVRKRVKEGLSAAIEINRSEIGVNDRLEQLVIAKTNLALNQRQLKFYLNDPNFSIAHTTNLITTSLPDLFNYQFDREKLITQASSNRLDILETELKLTEDAMKIEFLDNQTLPLFTLDYAYGALSNSGSKFSEAYTTVGNFDYNEWYVGLRFEMPITNQARKARLQNAVGQRLQRLSTKELQQLSVKREIFDTLDTLEQNWQRIILMRQQVAIAGVNYEAELKQFKEGLRTMTEVLEALSRLGEAEIREIRAITDYQITQIDLAFSTGTLLGYSRINFSKL